LSVINTRLGLLGTTDPTIALEEFNPTSSANPSRRTRRTDWAGVTLLPPTRTTAVRHSAWASSSSSPSPASRSMLVDDSETVQEERAERESLE
jgi:hypothetical protein